MNAINRGVVAGANGRTAISGVIAMRPTVSAFGRFIDAAIQLESYRRFGGRFTSFTFVWRSGAPMNVSPRTRPLTGDSGRVSNHARDLSTSFETALSVSNTPSPFTATASK